jgi:hypothetical protein
MPLGMHDAESGMMRRVCRIEEALRSRGDIEGEHAGRVAERFHGGNSGHDLARPTAARKQLCDLSSAP